MPGTSIWEDVGVSHPDHKRAVVEELLSRHTDWTLPISEWCNLKITWIVISLLLNLSW